MKEVLNMKHTPTQSLIGEVLAARYRLGETLWTFDARVTPQLEKLAKEGLVTVMDGNVEHSVRASLTDYGREIFLSSSYFPRQPVGKEEFAIESRTFHDGPWDRIDTGQNWTTRHGRAFTREEAEAEARAGNASNGSLAWQYRVVHRFVGPWEPLEKKS